MISNVYCGLGWDQGRVYVKRQVESSNHVINVMVGLRLRFGWVYGLIRSHRATQPGHPFVR